MKLCNFDKGNCIMNAHPDDDTTRQFQINLIKQMMSAGVVQALLSTLSRANEWPEIEKNISIVLSVLVTYEDDSTLLQRSAGTILTALYTLQIKSIAALKGNQNMQLTGGSSQESNCICYSNNLLHDDDDEEDFRNQKNEHDSLKGLLAAAVAKLSLVLASELGKLESPLMSGSGAFGGGAAAMNENTGIININQGHNNISSSVNSNRNSRNFSKSNGAPAIVENERILQILLNLIQTLCDDFLNDFTIMQQLQHLSINNLTHSNATFNDITITPPRIDKAVIQCSAALYRLAEVPQCRPVLVSNGALKLIKAWLEVGTHNLTLSRSVCFEENAKDQINKIEYFEQFGPVYELVSNAAAALMYISGGIDYRQVNYRVHVHSNSSSHFCYGNGGRDYVVGWIDAQILSEGLPTVVVNMIHKSMESFTSLQQVEIGSLTRSILPAAISMHLVQTLYQLYSRPQNRQQLQSIDVSHALCILFENITSQAKLIADQASMKRNHPSNSNVQTGINSDCPSNNIFLDIFHYGIDSNQHCSKVSQQNLSKLNANTLNAINTIPALLLSYMDDTLNPKSVSCESPGKHSHNILDEYELHPNDANIVYFASKQLSDDIMIVLSSVTSSCLEVLTCLFVNELNNMVPFSPSHPTSNLLINKNSSYNFNNRTSTSSLGLNKSIYLSVSELVCHKTLVESIKVASSLLPRGKGRLSTIRIISALTDSPEVLTALFEGGIMEILISVTLEAANLQTKLQTATDLKTLKNNQNNRGFAGLESSNSFFHTIFPVKPVLERTCSGASSLSGLSSATSNHPRTSKYLGGNQYFNEDDEVEKDDDGDEDASYYRKNIGNEETHLVCNSLANLCEAQDSYAQYLFSKDMFKVMLQLVRTNHMEISRQALRCISAMCKNMTSQSSVNEDSGGGDKFRGGSSPHFRENSINNKSKISSNNSAMFLEALDILCQCIRSPSSSIQRDATYTIALLALVDEKLQDRIVEGPLRTIVSLMVDPTVPRSIRSVAEDVLRNLGFLSGVKDFELCGYDFEILKDWYFMKRSLRHQDIALVILRKWIERLFESDDPSRQQQHLSEFELHHQLHDSIIYSNELAQETANILNEAKNSSVLRTVDNSIGNFNRNESESNLGLSNNAAIGSNTQTLNNKAEIRCNSDKVSGSKTMLSIPTFQRHFTETVRRFLPFLANQDKQNEVEKADSISNTTQSNSNDAYSVPITHFIDRNGTTPNNTNNNASTVHTGLPVSCSLGNIGSLAGLAAGLTSPSNAGVRTGRHQNGGNFMNSNSIDENYDWLDRPPAGILHLLDLFYSSKLHQILLMDLTSIGVILSTPHHTSPVHESNDDCADPSANNDISTSNILGNDVNNNNENNFSVDVGSFYVLPHPHAVSSIILPSRSYQSFTRVGRVIEKMIEYSDQNKMWSLLFRDSEYMGDFHTSLLSILRKCPQICSLSFAGTKRVEDDALLGHLVGQIPPSIRFLSFKSTLSRESIQALCILLRTHNAAFSIRDNDNLSNNSVHSHNHNSNDIALLKLSALENKNKNNNNMNPRRRKTIGSRGKGLLGLALTHLTFENAEINYIIELLQQQHYIKPSQRHSGTNKSVVNSSSSSTGPAIIPLLRNRSMSDSTLQSPESISSPSSLKSSISNNSNKKETFKGGIRFLDLSYNSLSDFTCGRILSGALLGPLEGLELRGNSIARSIKFAEVMEMFSMVKMIDCRHRLRYLGLSHNSLTSKAVAGILEPLVSNCTLTSLDLSDNEMEHSKEFNDTLRNFLRLNTGLRQLDLSNNHLNADTFKEIHLGLLENDSLLLLPLAGNYAVDKSPTISLIQIKLRENRLLYKSQTQTELDIIQQSNLTAYQSEEELGLRISSTSNNILELEGIDINAISILLDDDDMSMQHKPVLSSEAIPAIVSTAVSNNEQPMKSLLSQQYSDEKCLNLQSNPTLTSLTSSSFREEINTNDSLNTTVMKSEYDIGGVNQDSSDVGISIAIAVPIIDRSRAFSHDYQSSPGKSIPIIRTYSDTRGNHYTTQKIPNKMKSAFDDANISPPIDVNNNNISSEDNHHHHHRSSSSSSSSSNNALVITTSDLANTTTASLDLLASTPYEQFSQNTLNVFFSAPLAGFDSKKKPHPLQVLDYNAERELLMQVFKEVHRDVSVHFDFATTDALRTALSLGCKLLSLYIY